MLISTPFVFDSLLLYLQIPFILLDTAFKYALKNLTHFVPPTLITLQGLTAYMGGGGKAGDKIHQPTASQGTYLTLLCDNRLVMKPDDV